MHSSKITGTACIVIKAIVLILLIGFPGSSFAEKVRLYFDPTTPQIAFASGDIKAALEKHKHTVETADLTALANAGPGKKIVLATAMDKVAASMLVTEGGKFPAGLETQAYALRTTSKPALAYWVMGGDAVGAMYGGLQIAENISSKGLNGRYDSKESPFMLNRGMKLNLPLDRRIPTYVGGWSSNSAKKAIPHVWDMTFWTKLIDQQARNRYNMLSVWVHHPFPALVSLPDYPKACLPNIEGFDGFVKELDHEQRVAFWRAVMSYAHSRGMKFYFFNWNIYVDHAKDSYPGLKQDPKSKETIDYMSKSMRALLETYPELDGFGITSGDGMDGTQEENVQWTWDAMGRAVMDYLKANPSRRFNLIHRSVKASAEAVNAIYAPLKALPNATLDYSVKYAMAHMYSTTTPKWTGDIKKVSELGLKTWLTFRNDDYFYLNWGDPKFVRDFLTAIPQKEAVVGMYIGIDGFNPSRTYFCKNEVLNGQLEVERRWYMEMLWGRISYNPKTSDEVLKELLAKRYPVVSSDNLFEAWALASRSLPKVTELVMGEWRLDFHWYPEGCWSDPGRETGFRTIDGFANGTTVAKGSNLCDIATSAQGDCQGRKSSYEVADEMEADAARALSLINEMNGGVSADLEAAINNVKQMAYLSTYYAHKVRGATLKKAGNTGKARVEMGKAYGWWISYSRAMEASYHPDSFRNLQISPDWMYADAAVLKEYTDLGGKGIPECENMFALTVGAPHGSVSMQPSGGLYTKGTVVTLTANPDFGHAFGGWDGDLTGMVNPMTLTMNGKKNVTANFPASKGDNPPWIETFAQSNGTQSHGAPTSWRATRASGLFEVSGGHLMINGTGEEGVFDTAEIAIQGRPVKVSLEVQAAGGVDAGDYVRLYKLVDGGPPVQIGETIKGKRAGTQVLEEEKITGRRLKLRIVSKVSASDEFFYLDNLKVEYQ